MRLSKQRFVTAGGLLLATALLVYVADRPAAGQPVPPGGKKDKDKKAKVAGLDGQPFEFPEDRDAKNQLDQAPEYLKARDVQWRTLCKLLQDNLNSKSDSFYKFEDKDGERVDTRRVSVKTVANRIIAGFPKDGLIFYQQLYGQDANRALEDAVKKGYDPAALADVSQRYFHTRAGGQATVLLAAYYLDRGSYSEAADTYERLLARPNSDELLTPRTLYRAALALTRSGEARHAALAQKAWDQLTRSLDGGLVIGRKTYTLAELRAELGKPLDVTRLTGTLDWAMRAGNAGRNALAEGGPPYLDPLFTPATMFPPPPAGLDPKDANHEKTIADINAGNDWVKAQLERLYPRDGTARGVQLPAFFPVTAGDTIIFRTYDAVYAVAVRDFVSPYGTHHRAGQVVWSSESVSGVRKLVINSSETDVAARDFALKWWNYYLADQANTKDASPGVLYENPLLGGLTQDGRYLYLVDDLAIPPPPLTQVNEYNPNPIRNHPQSGPLAEAIKCNRLVALDVKTGSERWSLGRIIPPPLFNPQAAHDDKDAFRELPKLPRLTDEEIDKTDNAILLCKDDTIFLGPPLPLNGKLYVLAEREGTTRLLCLDPENMVGPGVPGRPEKAPALVWAQKLGSAIHPLPGDAVRRPQGCFLASGDGIMICPTNSGAVVAVDILSRSLLWGHTYRRHEPPPPPSPGSRPFNPDGSPIVRRQPLKESRWRAPTPIVVNGRVVLAAYDSDKLECLDLRTGAKLWEVPRDETDLYLGGVVNGKVIVVGKNRVRAYHLDRTDPKTAAGAPVAPLQAWESSESIPTPTGHGAATKTHYFVPVRQDAAGKENVPAAEIWAINVETGAVTSKSAARKRDDAADLVRYGLGNLVMHDGMVFAQSPWELAVYPQLDQKRAEMDRRLKANPNDPVGLTDRGELHLDDGKLKEAIADFKKAQQHNPPEGVRWRLREKLYVAYTELLRADFAAGEPYLDEYKALCELPADADDPGEKMRREAESVRRQRLFLCLLGKGRETQGRLGEAFDNYLALARLSGNKLDDDPEDPAAKMPPDVLARGRIERMLRRAKDPAARKALDDRVNKEWEAVRDANDLPRLREFVSVFGPFFPAGADAQLRLAERLLTTGDEADARDAQALLSQLRSTADSAVVRAKATEALARVMFDAGLLEDAVGLYLQLGQDYPTVPVRDGKTGTDYLTDLLTDKRLLPYLEPSRYPLPPRVKAEQRPGDGRADNNPIAYEVEPEGELFPAFRRLRFVLEVANPMHPTWTLRAYDRATGAERCRFPDLQMPINHSGTWDPGAVSLSKLVQAQGQLLLVQLGSSAYCLDLAEKKERWRRNLLGDGHHTANPTLVVPPSPDGDLVLKYNDNLQLTLGKTAVLQPGYVAVLTRTDLGRAVEVFEPLTGRPLWTRYGISDRAMVFGDPQFVLVVETDGNRVPQATRLLRAGDGIKVDGAANAGPLMAAAKSYRVVGKTVLLSEAANDRAPRVLRLHDIAAGKDVWRKEYHANAKPVRSLNPAWCGFIDPDGPAEVLDVRTGAKVATLAPDPEDADEFGVAFEACTAAVLLADAGRYYLVLDQERDVNAPSAGPVRRPGGYHRYRSLPVNGPIYAFDRATGKQAWAVGKRPFEGQALILDHFAELPVLVAAAAGTDRSGVVAYRVAVVEKDRGLLLFDKPLTQMTSFQSIQIDAKNGTVDFRRPDTQVRISPDR